METEDIYVIKRTEIDMKNDPTGARQLVSLRSTYVDLRAAKEASKTALFEEGYEREWFPTFDVRADNADSWTHGDGVQVYAVAPEGEIFKVEIETVPNRAGFTGDDNGKVVGDVWHVLQTTIHYNLDRSGAKRDTVVEGTYRTFDAAKQAALGALLDEDVTKESFEEYDENTGQEDWPFDEDTMVHAVGQGGENYLIQVLEGS